MTEEIKDCGENTFDSYNELTLKRAKLDSKLKATFESIFEKYGRDFDGIGDEIDIATGEIVVNNGHVYQMQDEKDAGDGCYFRKDLRGFVNEFSESSDISLEEDTICYEEDLDENAESEYSEDEEAAVSGDDRDEDDLILRGIARVNRLIQLSSEEILQHKSQRHIFNFAPDSSTSQIEMPPQVMEFTKPDFGLQPQNMGFIASRNALQKTHIEPHWRIPDIPAFKQDICVEPAWMVPDFPKLPTVKLNIPSTIQFKRSLSPEAAGSIWAPARQRKRRKLNKADKTVTTSEKPRTKRDNIVIHRRRSKSDPDENSESHTHQNKGQAWISEEEDLPLEWVKKSSRKDRTNPKVIEGVKNKVHSESSIESLPNRTQCSHKSIDTRKKHSSIKSTRPSVASNKDLNNAKSDLSLLIKEEPLKTESGDQKSPKTAFRSVKCVDSTNTAKSLSTGLSACTMNDQMIANKAHDTSESTLRSPNTKTGCSKLDYITPKKSGAGCQLLNLSLRQAGKSQGLPNKNITLGVGVNLKPEEPSPSNAPCPQTDCKSRKGEKYKIRQLEGAGISEVCLHLLTTLSQASFSCPETDFLRKDKAGLSLEVGVTQHIKSVHPVNSTLHRLLGNVNPKIPNGSHRSKAPNEPLISQLSHEDRPKDSEIAIHMEFIRSLIPTKNLMSPNSESDRPITPCRRKLSCELKLTPMSDSSPPLGNHYLGNLFPVRGKSNPGNLVSDMTNFEAKLSTMPSESDPVSTIPLSPEGFPSSVEDANQGLSSLPTPANSSAGIPRLCENRERPTSVNFSKINDLNPNNFNRKSSLSDSIVALIESPKSYLQEISNTSNNTDIQTAKTPIQKIAAKASKIISLEHVLEPVIARADNSLQLGNPRIQQQNREIKKATTSSLKNSSKRGNLQNEYKSHTKSSSQAKQTLAIFNSLSEIKVDFTPEKLLPKSLSKRQSFKASSKFISKSEELDELSLGENEIMLISSESKPVLPLITRTRRIHGGLISSPAVSPCVISRKRKFGMVKDEGDMDELCTDHIKLSSTKHVNSISAIRPDSQVTSTKDLRAEDENSALMLAQSSEQKSTGTYRPRGSISNPKYAHKPKACTLSNSLSYQKRDVDIIKLQELRDQGKDLSSPLFQISSEATSSKPLDKAITPVQDKDKNKDPLATAKFIVTVANANGLQSCGNNGFTCSKSFCFRCR